MNLNPWKKRKCEIPPGIQPLHQKFFEALDNAQTQRPVKGGWVSDSELEWMVFERETMFDLVNSERAIIGKQPVGLEEIKKAERQATGHIDYTRKFSLYCSWLVSG